MVSTAIVAATESVSVTLWVVYSERWQRRLLATTCRDEADGAIQSHDELHGDDSATLQAYELQVELPV